MFHYYGIELLSELTIAREISCMENKKTTILQQRV